MFTRLILVLSILLVPTMPMARAEQSLGDAIKKIFATPTPTPKPRKKKSASTTPKKSPTPSVTPSPKKKKTSLTEEETPSPTPKKKKAATPRETESPEPSPSASPKKKHTPVPEELETPKKKKSSPTPSPTGSPHHKKKTSPSPEPSETPAPTPTPEESEAPTPKKKKSSPAPSPTGSPHHKKKTSPSPEPSETPAPTPTPEESPSASPVKKHGAANASLSPDEIKGFDNYSPKVQKLLASALELTTRNLDYKYGSDDPASGGMDCSGFVYFVLKQNGVGDVPRDSAEQYNWLRHARQFEPVMSQKEDSFELEDLKPGDLLFWTGTYSIERDPPITHAMIYLGREKKTGHRVMVGSSDGRVYQGESRNGVSVFDFNIHRAKTSEEGKLHPLFIGYGHVPGLNE